MSRSVKSSCKELNEIQDYAEDEAGKLVEKVEGILAGVSNLKKGLCAIRQKDIDEIRKIVEEIDESDWIRILRERYGDSSLAQRLANDLEAMRSRCNLLMEKFEDMLRNGFILTLNNAALQQTSARIS